MAFHPFATITHAYVHDQSARSDLTHRRGPEDPKHEPHSGVLERREDCGHVHESRNTAGPDRSEQSQYRECRYGLYEPRQYVVRVQHRNSRESRPFTTRPGRSVYRLRFSSTRKRRTTLRSVSGVEKRSLRNIRSRSTESQVAPPVPTKQPGTSETRPMKSPRPFVPVGIELRSSSSSASVRSKCPWSSGQSPVRPAAGDGGRTTRGRRRHDVPLRLASGPPLRIGIGLDETGLVQRRRPRHPGGRLDFVSRRPRIRMVHTGDDAPTDREWCCPGRFVDCLRLLVGVRSDLPPSGARLLTVSTIPAGTGHTSLPTRYPPLRTHQSANQPCGCEPNPRLVN